MSPRSRSSSGVRVALTLVVGVVCASPWSLAGAGATSARGPLTQAASVCPPIPGYSGENSTLFEEICGEPSFQAALEERGFANFTTSELVVSGGTTFYLGFSWVAPCGNTTEYAPANDCEFQEDWQANVTSGTIAGPVSIEGPVICSCGEETAPAPSLLPIVIPLGLAPVAITAPALAVVILRRRVAIRPPPDESDSRRPPSR